MSVHVKATSCLRNPVSLSPFVSSRRPLWLPFVLLQGRVHRNEPNGVRPAEDHIQYTAAYRPAFPLFSVSGTAVCFVIYVCMNVGAVGAFSGFCFSVYTLPRAVSSTGLVGGWCLITRLFVLTSWYGVKTFTGWCYSIVVVAFRITGWAFIGRAQESLLT